MSARPKICLRCKTVPGKHQYICLPWDIYIYIFKGKPTICPTCERSTDLVPSDEGHEDVEEPSGRPVLEEAEVLREPVPLHLRKDDEDAEQDAVDAEQDAPCWWEGNGEKKKKNETKASDTDIDWSRGWDLPGLGLFVIALPLLIVGDS